MLKNIELIKQQEYCIPIKEYFEIVAKKVDVYAVLLFGSVARGDAKPFRTYESDIDIIVVINDIHLDLGRRMLYKIDVESGIILFDQEGFLQKKKSDLFMELKNKGVSRLKWGWSWNIKVGEVVEM